MRRIASVLALVAVCSVASPSSATELQPRHVRAKPESSRLTPGLRDDLLIVKFVDASRTRLRGGRLVSLSGAVVDEANRLAVEAPDVKLDRLLTRTEAHLEHDRTTAELRTGQAMADLNGYYTIRLSPASPARAEALLDALNALDVVEIAYAEPIPSNAVIEPEDETALAGAESGSTPDFQSLQDYHDPAPLGIDVAVAWALPGGHGEGVKIIDVETGFRWTHEDQPVPFFEEGVPSTDDHGLAVVGELAAPDNGFGVVGIVHQAQIGGHVVFEVPTALVFDTVASALAPGDFMVIELQAPGPLPGGDITNVPMEFFQANFDVLQTAAANGVIVVAAAGNGHADLDDPVYQGLFDRNVRDSGAIMVGATEGGSLVPADFSNHGTRVDLSGWGRDVVTCGYGTLYDGGPDATYTDGFSGTSSATPIVTGAAAALQGIYRNGSGDVPLPGRTLADILKATGTPTAGPQLIGPRPNLALAIPAMQAGFADIGGTVRDLDTSLPLAGSQIRVLENGARTMTAADGTWELTLVPGTWNVQVSRFGYVSFEYEVTVALGGSDDRIVDLAMLPTTTVSGLVVDRYGDPLAGAEVYIQDTPFSVAITNQAGEYAIGGIPVPFTGTAFATRADLAPDARPVVATLGPANVDFRLVVPTYDFESDDGGLVGGAEWEWGTPTAPAGPDAHGGTNCWGTDLADTYDSNANHLLTLSVDLPETAPRLAYWQWYDVWAPYDGITVQVRREGDPDFEALLPVEGYTDPCVWNLGDPCGPGWGGRSGSWIPGVHDLSAFAGETVEMRFLLGTSSFSTGLGWYIDDLAIYADVDQLDETVCIEIELDPLPMGDPHLLMHDHHECSIGSPNPREADLIYGNLSALRIVAGEVRLGFVTQIACGDPERFQVFEPPSPDSSEAVFYLARETGVEEYGTGSSGQPRLTGPGNCP